MNNQTVIHVLATIGAHRRWTPVTLELLGDATALAQRWSGQVGAWVLSDRGDSLPPVEELAAHGCQVIRHLKHDRFARWSSEAIAAALVKNIADGCRLVMLPGGSHGDEVAALLAERLDTDWIADALTLSVTRTGALEVVATLPGGKLARNHRPIDEKPMVVTMRPGVAEARKVESRTSPEVHQVAVDLSDVPELTSVEQFLPADPKTVDLVFARRIVAGGRGTGGPEGMREVEQLAEVLDASVGASRMVVDRGWAPQTRQIGQTGKTVTPDLYVALGISGASHHLAGMRQSKHIVAINPDRNAPIHEIAHLSLHGDLHQLIPAIEAAVQRRRKTA